MTDLDRVKNWVLSYDGALPVKDLKVDYFAAEPDNGSIDPSGLVEVSRTEDILGNVEVENQLNFALYFVLLKSPGDDTGATNNAALLMDFQRWIQEQSIRKKAPVFGDEPDREAIKAQNGALYAANQEGTAIYMVQLSINFIKKYEV